MSSQPAPVPRWFRYLVIALAVLVLAGGSSLTLAATATAVSQSFLTIDIETRDSSGDAELDLFLPLPVALVEVGLLLAPLVIPEDQTREMRVALDDANISLPALAELIDDLPDATLVQVDDRDEHIRIGKEDGALVIRVESDQERIAIHLPTRLVRRAARLAAI